MKLKSYIIIFASLLFSSFEMGAQIFGPEGVNMPGQWNSFVNPPAAGSVFGNENQVSSGKIKFIAAGTPRWQTQIFCSETSGDVPAGSYDFLFTSGPANNAFQNKWAGVNVNINQLQDYVFNTGADNNITLADGKWYTVNWQDNGYQPTKAIFMETTLLPAFMVSATQAPSGNTVDANTPVQLTTQLGQESGPDQFFYIRYSTDNYATSQVVLMTVNGFTATGTIPGFAGNTNVNYYFFSSSVSNITSDFDMHSINILNNGGLNYNYTTQATEQTLDLGPDQIVCTPGSSVTLSSNADFETYLWSNGETTPSITVNQLGTYWLTATTNGISQTDTIKVISGNPFSFQVLGGSGSICSQTGEVTLSTSTPVYFAGDSLTIIYDASQGVSQLQNANKVYFHSGVAFSPQGPWTNVVGNWGQDDGIGEMTSLGNNLWSITINPSSYYGLAPGATFSGIWCVFRNEDGTLTGKNQFDQDIYINAIGNPAWFSTFSGIQAQFTMNPFQQIVWSNNATSSSITVNQSGTYSATITNNFGCTATASTTIAIEIVPTINLGEDVLTCGANINQTLQAPAGFQTYLWSTGSTSNSIDVTTSGIYSVLATTANGCVARDTIRLQNNIAPFQVNLGDDLPYCTVGSQVYLDAGFAIVTTSDSLTIIYDATQGQTGLVGTQKVYFHAGYELVPFGGAQGFVGNWGQDDGVGRMTALGNNRWKITINPQAYFGLPSNQAINGIFMVFRNANGTATGKDDNGNDIFLNLGTYPPTSAFQGITPILQRADEPVFSSVLWSNGSLLSGTFVVGPGTYWVRATTPEGCISTDTVVVFNANPPVVDLGPNLDICPGDPVTVDAGAGFNTYSWSTGATSQSISVNAVGTYVVVVTNESGCEAFDFISVTATGVPVAIATVSTISGLTVNIANQSAGANQALWDFNGDGVTDLSSTSANISYTYTNAGTYTAQLIVVGACGNDTLTFPIQVVLSNGQEIENKTVNVYPNPANDFVQIISDNAIALIEIMDINGRVVIRNQPSNGNNTHHLGVDQLANGVYQIRISGANGQWISSQKFIKQ